MEASCASWRNRMSGKPLQVYSFIPRRHTASFYYRIAVPLHTAKDLGLPVKVIIDTDDANVDINYRIMAAMESDVCLYYQPVGEVPLQQFRSTRRIIPSKRDDGWKWPPSMVIDTDDNLFD